MPRITSRQPLFTALLGAALATACTGSVDSTPNLDASNSNVDADGQVARDGQANNDSGRNDGGTLNDAGLEDSNTQTSDAQTTEPDAAVATDGSVVVQPSGEPVFVAFGPGFWTATSCDRGRSWRLREENGDREDHGEWSAFARMAFGNGTFVGATGWGFPGHVLSSSGGLGFANKLDTSSGCSGVGYTGSEFVLLTGDQVRRSNDGKTWAAGAFSNVPAGTQQIRRFRMFAESGVAIASVETQNGSDHAIGPWTLYSTDGLHSWKEASGNFSTCAVDIQQAGDIVAAGSTLYMGAPSGALCRSTDTGKSWQSAGTIPGGALADLWSDGQSFYALANKTVYRLEGAEWKAHGTVDASSGAGATSGITTVISSGAKFFWSDNLSTWQQGTSSVIAGTSGAPLTSPSVRDMVVGHFSKACP